MSGGVVKPQLACSFDEALHSFLALRSRGLDPALMSLVADALGSAFALGAAWTAQHGVRTMHEAVDAQLAHADVVIRAMEALVTVQAQALGRSDVTTLPMH